MAFSSLFEHGTADNKGTLERGTATGEQLLSSFSSSLATPAEEELLVALRADLAEDLKAAPAFPELVGDFRLLRSLRAAKHNLQEAAEVFRAHLQHRRNLGLDAIRNQVLARWGERLQEIPSEELPGGGDVSKYLVQSWPFTYTPRGDPVCLYRLGEWRMADYVREVEDWKEACKENAYYQLESRALLLDKLSGEQGRLVHIVNIFDLEDWSLTTHLDATFCSFVKDELLSVIASYQDFSSYAFFINTSRFFTVPYNMFYPLLPKGMQEKLFLQAGDYCKSERFVQELGASCVAALQDGAQIPPKPVTEGSVERLYFALVAPGSGADVETQSWLHAAILEPLAQDQTLNEFRLLSNESSLSRASTVLVFELLMTPDWQRDEEVIRWRQRLKAGGIELLGPEQTAKAVEIQAMGDPASPCKDHCRLGDNSATASLGLPALHAFEKVGVPALAVELLLLVLCVWLSLE